MTSIPVPDTSVSSVRHQYRYRTLRSLRYDINTGTGHFGKFGTTWIPVPPVPVKTFIPVPDTSVSSVRHPYPYREYRYHTEHTLVIFVMKSCLFVVRILCMFGWLCRATYCSVVSTWMLGVLVLGLLVYKVPYSSCIFNTVVVVLEPGTMQ